MSWGWGAVVGGGGFEGGRGGAREWDGEVRVGVGVGVGRSAFDEVPAFTQAFIAPVIGSVVEGPSREDNAHHHPITHHAEHPSHAVPHTHHAEHPSFPVTHTHHAVTECEDHHPHRLAPQHPTLTDSALTRHPFPAERHARSWP